MPCLSGQIQNKQIIFGCQVVKASAVMDESSDLANLPTYRTLLDTGAQLTCIKQSVVDRANLEQSGRDIFHGIGGKVESPTYIVDLYISVFEPTGGLNKDGELEQNLIGRKRFENLRVSLLEGDAFDFDVLFGMDVITQCSFSMDKDKQFELCI